MRSSTNMTVAEDMLPFSRSTVRDGIRASRWQVERTLDGVEHRFAAGMNGPQVDVGDARLPRIVPIPRIERVVDRGRHLTRQHHVEAIVTHAPGHQFPAVGRNDGPEAVQAKPVARH